MAKAPFFNNKGIGKLTLPKEREQYKTLGDGLYIKLTPTGNRVFYHFGRTRKWHRIGEYPGTSLTDARARNATLKQDTDQGIDPSLTTKPLTDPTVKELFDHWYGKAADKEGRPWSDLYKLNVRYIFEADVLPKIGKMKLATIRKTHVNQIVQAVIDRGATSHARQVFLRLKRFFNYAAEEEYIELSPMISMPTKGTANKKERALKSDEIKVFFESLHQADMSKQTAGVLELILRTGQRPSECSGIHKDEVDGDWWTIPGARTKNGLAHRVYLTPSVKALLGEPNSSGYYFGSLTQKRTTDKTAAPLLDLPLHRNAISKALRRSMTGKEKRQNDTEITIPIEPFTPHDLRRTCATHLAELGFTDDVIGAVLNHKKRTVTGIYNRHQYDAEKKRAMLAFERKLTGILTEKPSGKVVNIR